MKKLLSILILCFGCNLYSQIYSFKNFTEDDGLPQVFIYDILQDNKGFLYIGTGNGLAIYGGNSFNILSKEKGGLLNDFVTTLYRDSKNRVLIGHLEGKVSIWDKGKVEQVLYKEEIGSKIIQILELAPDNYLFLKSMAGFILYNSATQAYTNIENDNFNEVTSVISKNGELLLLKPDGVYSIKVQSLMNKNYATTQVLSLKEGVLMRQNVAKDNIIIADNRLGILRFQNDGKLTSIDTFKLVRNDGSMFKRILADRFSNIYVATSDNGVYKIIPEKKTIINYTTKNGLTTNSVESIFIDREDNLWIGTAGNGLQQLNNELYSYNTIIDDQGHPLQIYATTKVNGRIVVACKKGVGYFKDDKIAFASNPKLSGKSFNCLVLYKNEFICATTEGELFKTDTLFKNVTKIPLATTNSQLFINSIYFDDQNIYACSTSGLYVINPSNFQYQLLNTGTGLPHNNIRSIFIDSKKHMWICSKGTPIYYLTDLKDVKIFENVPGLEKFDISTVCEDGDHNIWVATIGDGVFKYNGKYFEHFNTKQGLKSNYCYAIVADFTNGIWVNHTNGISYKNKNKKTFNKIGGGTDIQQNSFIENACYYDKDDHEIFFGTHTGIVTINTNKQKFNEVENALNILQITLNDAKLSAFKDTTLAYSAYDLSIDFLGVCLSDPGSVKYKYKLEGLQDEFVEVSSETRKINFPKLKDGDYTLQIQSSNNDGLWNSVPVTFKLSIKSPIWKQIWFYVILVLIISVVFFLIIKARTRKLLEEQKKLEGIIAEKTEQIVKEKEVIEELFVEIKVKNKDITDSINYAKRIQEALLPLDAYMKEVLDVAYFYQAKDIVSGDFYWYKKTQDHVFIAAVDCTGHGVPGAFMSFIGSTILEDIVGSDQKLNPVEILHKLDFQVNKVLNQHSREGEMNLDGMDISLCKFTPKTNILEFTAAVRPIYIYRNNELEKFKTVPYSIGGAFKQMVKPYALNTWEVQKGDNVFLFSDGYTDQTGGGKGKKYSSTRLGTFLLTIADMPTEEQQKLMAKEFFEWKGEEEQVDDVLLMSIKF